MFDSDTYSVNLNIRWDYFINSLSENGMITHKVKHVCLKTAACEGWLAYIQVNMVSENSVH